MAAFVRALVAGLLLASLAVSSGAAEGEFCVADDDMTCPRPLAGDDVAQPEADAIVTPVGAADIAPMVPTPATTTDLRTIGPALVIKPFADVGGPAPRSVPAPEVLIPQPPPPLPEKLPPGPADRAP
jgi:hypothetical protein